MAKYPCPECNKPVSETADACPKCGAKITPQALARMKKSAQNIQFVAVGCFLVIVLMCGGFLIRFGGTNTSPTNTNSTSGLYQYDKPIIIQGEDGKTHTIPAGTYTREELAKKTREIIEQDR